MHAMVRRIPGPQAAGRVESRPIRGRRRALALAATWLAITLLASIGAAGASAAEVTVVRAVLFYSPTCPHCHQVMTEDLPPIQARYGDGLDVLMVDVTGFAGADLYGAAVERFGIPENRIGVPTMIVGDTVLVGSVEIPEMLPSLVELLLADGGADWPAIPGLAAFIPAPPTASGTTAPAAGSPASSPVAGTPEAASPGTIAGDTAASGGGDAGIGTGMLDRAARDPAGSALAIAILVALVVALAWAIDVLLRSGLRRTAGTRSAVIPVLAVLGLSIAAYLSSVELSGAAAVCGPVGDCNAVHTSEYARLLGIPVGLLGVLGYVAILGLWLAVRFGGPVAADRAAKGIVAGATIGTAFSVYLTFLEPFVIGATCAWCLASAVLIGAILTLSVAPARRPSIAT